MKSNESTADRAVRVLVGLVAVVVAFVVGAGSAVGIVLLVVAAIMVVTGLVGFCPLYRLFGLSTRRSSPTGQR